ncbi:MAG: VOC family protein [Myxococcales bacterium]|nr:VOC family protein [Myxococcales bacterium]
MESIDRTGIFTPGRFVWHEIMTSDVERSQNFFTALFGWTVESWSMGEGGSYTGIKNGERGMGGMMQIPAGDPRPPHTVGYVSVADVDAAVARAKALGGQVGFGPMDIPDVGRFAVLGDPQGAWFTVFRDCKGDGPEPGRPAAGDFCWDTLSTTDLGGAKSFYREICGWDVSAPGDAEAMWVQGELMRGDIQPVQGGAPAHWLTHIAVNDLVATVARASELGGVVIIPRLDIDPWGTMALIQDPCGVMFSAFQSAG